MIDDTSFPDLPLLELFVDGDVLCFRFRGDDKDPLEIETGERLAVTVAIPRGAEPLRLAIAMWSAETDGCQPHVAPYDDMIDRLLRGHANQFALVDKRRNVWRLIRPTYLTILHPGRFTFVAELVYRDHEGQQQRVKLDPDVIVRGGYPPHG